MDFDKELAKLIKEFTSMTEKGTYVDKNFTDKEKAEITAALASLINNYLMSDDSKDEQGCDDEEEQQTVKEKRIAKHARQLRTRFHPDHLLDRSPEIQWIERAISNDSKNDTCFTLVQKCIDYLHNPKICEEDKEYFDQVESVGKFLQLLRGSKNIAQTMADTSLLDSLIGLIGSVQRYHEKMTTIHGDNLLGKVVQATPYVINGVLLTLVLDKIAIFFAATFLLAKGGILLQTLHSPALNIVGIHMRALGLSLTKFAAALLARSAQFNFSLTASYNYMIAEALRSLYHLIRSQIEEPEPVIAPQHRKSIIFKTQELNAIAYPLKLYADKQSQQFFSRHRLGNKKSNRLAQVLHDLHGLDEAEIALLEKINGAGTILNKVAKERLLQKKKSEVYKALKNARKMQRQLAADYRQPLAIEYNQETDEETHANLMSPSSQASSM